MGNVTGIFTAFHPLPGSMDIFAGEKVTRLGLIMHA